MGVDPGCHGDTNRQESVNSERLDVNLLIPHRLNLGRAKHCAHASRNAARQLVGSFASSFLSPGMFFFGGGAGGLSN